MRNAFIPLVIGVCLGVTATLLLVSGGLSVVKAACQDNPCLSPPCCNGDVNADGAVNIADAVALLMYLFVDGPEPVERALLAATGQAICYDDVGQVVDCGSSDFPGQDGFYQVGRAVEGRFADNGDGTISDFATHLMWQGDTADVDGDGSVTEDDMVTWQEALQYCDHLILAMDGTWTTDVLEAEDHGGVKYDDFRLPNVRELESLVMYGQVDTLLPPIFSGHNSSCHWSSTTALNSPDSAWFVFFRTECPTPDKSGLLYLRAVRGGL